jgi:hypothetical protein
MLQEAEQSAESRQRLASRQPHQWPLLFSVDVSSVPAITPESSISTVKSRTPFEVRELVRNEPRSTAKTCRWEGARSAVAGAPVRREQAIGSWVYSWPAFEPGQCPQTLDPTSRPC